MKKLTIIILLITIFTIGVFSLLARLPNVIAGQPSMSDETPPPSPDPNRELKPYIAPTTPPLPMPLTENQALEQAVYFDTVGGVVWVEPWSSETIINNPE